MHIIFALYAFKYNIIYMLIIACLFKKAIGARDKVHEKHMVSAGLIWHEWV